MKKGREQKRRSGGRGEQLCGILVSTKPSERSANKPATVLLHPSPQSTENNVIAPRRNPRPVAGPPSPPSNHSTLLSVCASVYSDLSYKCTFMPTGFPINFVSIVFYVIREILRLASLAGHNVFRAHALRSPGQNLFAPVAE